MSDKKIIDMDDLMLDNISLDSLTALPNVPDPSSDWKHKDTSAQAATGGNSVDELDVSSVDLSVLDPEQEGNQRNSYSGGSYFNAAPEEEQAPAPAPAAPKFVPPSGGITVERITMPPGGIEVGKISSPQTPSAPAAPKPQDTSDILAGLNLPPLKKVSIDQDIPQTRPAPAPISVPAPGEQGYAPQAKPVSVPSPAEQASVPLKSVEVPAPSDNGLPPLKSVSVPSASDSGLPPLKPVSVPTPSDNGLPPLKPASKPTPADNDLPPLKPASKPAPKNDDSGLPPLKPVSVSKKDDSGLPPLKPVQVEKKPADTLEKESDNDSYYSSKKSGSEPLPADMSDVTAPKLDDMMEFATPKAAFEQPENKVEGMQDPFANTNMSAARRKKLEQGFDAPVVMRHIDAGTAMQIQQQEDTERFEKGRSAVMVIGIIYIILNIIGLISDFSVRGAIRAAIRVGIMIELMRGVRSARIWYIVLGIITGVLEILGVSVIIAAYATSGESMDILLLIDVITVAIEAIYFIVTAVMLFANKNIRAYFSAIR